MDAVLKNLFAVDELFREKTAAAPDNPSKQLSTGHMKSEKRSQGEAVNNSGFLTKRLLCEKFQQSGQTDKEALRPVDSILLDHNIRTPRVKMDTLPESMKSDNE